LKVCSMKFLRGAKSGELPEPRGEIMSILKDVRIFIVEDNMMNRVVYTITLKSQGAWVEFDRLGRDTLYRIKKFNPDIIILDLMLGQCNSGYAIFDEIKRLSEYDSVPIIAVSASDPAVALPKTQAQGFDGYIAKPIDDVRFPQQISSVLAGEQIWDPGDRFL